MLISVVDLENEPLEFDETIPPQAMDYVAEVKQLGNVAIAGRADVVHEHRGPRDIVADIRLRAAYQGLFEVPCARCVDPVEHRLSDEFDLIFRPVGADGEASEHSITTSETEIGYYQQGAILLEDVLREQVLLALPLKTLCQESCKGLCPRCGTNLNTESCTCEGSAPDPRWTALSELRSRIKH